MAAQFSSGFKWWLEAMLGFFYPPVCQLCHAEPARPQSGYVGEACRRKVRRILPPYCEHCGLPYEGDITTRFVCTNCQGLGLEFDFARSAAVASGLLLEAIHRYKYQRELWYENFLGPLLVEAAAPSLQDGGWNLIVPVPLHPVKKREREFNQAVRLARLLGSACRIPVQANLLRRVRATQTQTRLHRQERRSNMAGAFAPTTGFRLSGQSVVVVDDVLTTGSTTSECASVLRSLGASRVAVWTVARGL